MPKIDQSTNAHNPLKTQKVKFFVGLLTLFILAKTLLSLLASGQQTTASDLTIEGILKAVNEQRAIRNLVLLNTNSRLSTAAQSKADDMQARHYFAHVDPDGKYIWEKIVAAGYTPYAQLGENLAIEFYDTESLISAWMNSPTHRANVLQEGFRDQGMGLTFGDPSQGQYHSAIANTFGTLAGGAQPKPAPSPAPTTPAPKPAPQPLPPPPQTPPTLPPFPPIQPPPPPPLVKPQPQPTPPPPVPSAKPVKTESGTQNETNEHNFSLPGSQNQASPSPLQTSADSVVGRIKDTKINLIDSNRYLALIFGIALVLFLLSDLKDAIEKGAKAHFDKKTNNLFLLVIAIVVIAFLYWF